MQRARLVTSGALHPFLNMALDEALAADPPVLRLYRFDPPGLSLGYFQPAADFDAATIAELGAVVVRRATGGGAILHQDDVTFSFVARPDHPAFAGPVRDSYARIHRAVAGGLARLGIAVTSRDRAPPVTARDADPICFHAITTFDLVAAGKKLVGSAQRRTRERVLHHGSIPIRANRLATGATCVEDLIGRRPEPAELESALAAGFATELGLAFEASAISAEEQARAEALAIRRYGNPAWTEAR